MAVDTHTVNAIKAKSAIKRCFEIKRPVFLWGPPGIGKSEVIAELASEANGLMIDLRLGQMDPTDIRGIPFYNKDNGKMDWAAPIELPDAETAAQYPVVVLFLDEMNTAAPMVQAAAYQLILNRCVGKYVLPDNVVIVAAGNRDSDKGITYRMPTPLANRFIHVEMKADFEAWETWAVSKKISPAIVGYLNYSKGDLYDFDPKSGSRSFASPRSWAFVNEILADDLDDEIAFTLISGAVGEGLATKFLAHRKVSSKLPNIMDVLTGKTKDLKVKEISAMYTLASSMCYELKAQRDDKNVTDVVFNEYLNNVLVFMMANFETELVVMGIRVAIKKFGIAFDPRKIACYPEFETKYKKYIIGK